VNWKCRRKCPWLLWRCCSSIHLVGLRKTIKTPIRKTGVPSEIRAEDLPNRSVERYRSATRSVNAVIYVNLWDCCWQNLISTACSKTAAGDITVAAHLLCIFWTKFMPFSSHESTLMRIIECCQDVILHRPVPFSTRYELWEIYLQRVHNSPKCSFTILYGVVGGCNVPRTLLSGLPCKLCVI
jgi:hypothetical protein